MLAENHSPRNDEGPHWAGLSRCRLDRSRLHAGPAPKAAVVVPAVVPAGHDDGIAGPHGRLGDTQMMAGLHDRY